MASEFDQGGSPLKPIAASFPRLIRSLSPLQKRLLSAPECDADSAIIYQHSVLCHTSLPYRNPGDACRRWTRRNGFLTLEIEAGRVFDARIQNFIDVGLPYGPKPRLVLYHLHAEALRLGSREIPLEDTLTGFIRRTLGLDATGRNIQAVREQLTRLAASDFRLGRSDAERSTTVSGRILNGLTLWTPEAPAKRLLWPTHVRFSQEYFESLTHHAIPLNETAVARLSHNAMALDIYAWLAQRLHRIEPGKSPSVSWLSLAEQFGGGYGELRAFRRVFKRTLAQVKVVYPDAQVELSASGMELKQSRPPVAKRLFVVRPQDSQALTQKG